MLEQMKKDLLSSETLPPVQNLFLNNSINPCMIILTRGCHNDSKPDLLIFICVLAISQEP